MKKAVFLTKKNSEMKQELIKRLNACCALTFTLMMTWIDAIIFPNDMDGSFKSYLKTQVKPNGELPNSAWLLLLMNAQFEENSPITSAVAVEWLTNRPCPTCAQYKVIINALKIAPNFPIYIESDALDLVELDFNLYSIQNLEKNKAYMVPLAWKENGLIEGHQIFVHVPEFKIKNFDMIKDLNPYLVIERLMPSSKFKGKKSGWKRDKTMMILGGQFHAGFGLGNKIISEDDGYRPNEIPLTSSKQQIDLFIENYFILPSLTARLKKVGFGRRDSILFRDSPAVELKTLKSKINLRVRIAYKIGNTERVSKPLNYFSIFAQQGNRMQLTNSDAGDPNEPCVVFSIGR